MTKILIVDDKENNLLALETVLNVLGVDIIKAMNGEDALRATLNHEFALAILDVQMPLMDGYELASLLRGDSRTRHIPIIFLSAVYFDDPYIFKGYISGAVDFITKPFNPDILLSKVKIFLELDAQKNEIIRQKADLANLVIQLEQQIEARKKAEQELMQARVLEALGTLAGGIAHDFNNMLSAILGQIELAGIHGGCDERTRTLLDEARNFILKATDLTGKYLTFSGGGKPYKKPIPLKPILEETIAPILTDERVKYEFMIQDGLWDIEADTRQIKQVFFAIINNAREAMPEGGIITVRAINWESNAAKESDGIIIKNGWYVKISIADQGPGMTEDQLSKIFNPYFTTKKMSAIKGMGLGLTLAHSIVTKHDGYIRAKSPEEGGSIIDIYLPALKNDQFTGDVYHMDSKQWSRIK